MDGWGAVIGPIYYMALWCHIWVLIMSKGELTRSSTSDRCMELMFSFVFWFIDLISFLSTFQTDIPLVVVDCFVMLIIIYIPFHFICDVIIFRHFRVFCSFYSFFDFSMLHFRNLNKCLFYTEPSLEEITATTKLRERFYVY